MERDREAVGFVSDALQEVQRLARSGKDDRIFFSRYPYLFESLGQADYRNVGDPQLVEDRRCGRDLGAPPSTTNRLGG